MEVKEKIKEIAIEVEKEELLARLLEKEGIEIPQATVIKRIPREGPLPLSFAQERLWFLDQLEPGRPFYNIPGAVRLTGHLDLPALEMAFSEILRRHESLRTTFSTVEGRPIQVIHPESAFSLFPIDITGFSEKEREAESLRLATEEARRPFDLAKGPLIRGTLLKLGPEDHVVLATMHHIISDGWSIGIFIKEVASLYESFSQGRPSSLTDLPIQYADFAQWQREWMKGTVLEKQLSYWKEKLQGSPALHELPSDRPRPPIQSFHGASETFTLSKTLSESLKNLGQKEGTTLFMTLLAAFQVLLYRYSRQEDICVGSPIANRNRAEIESLIGFFVNTLVLRTDCSGNPTFKGLLRRVGDVCLGAYAHQGLPFEKLVEEINPQRSLSHTPLFQVMFVLQNTPTEEIKLPGLVLNRIPLESETAKFDLTLTMEETIEGLKGSMGYNTDLYNGYTIERMISNFVTLLERVVVDPNHDIASLPLLTEQERHQILMEWNDTERSYPKDKCIHHLFEEQVEKSPENTAIVFEDQSLSYRELNTKSDQLAYYLRKLGVGPEVLVGICMERSLEMIIALMGILKVGGAYVPLDPNYPKNRLSFILEDTQAPILLTQERLLEGLPECKANRICLDRDWKAISKNNPQHRLPIVQPENLAYVIYTSGSTGFPKGVQVEHRHLINYIFGLLDRMDLKSAAAYAMVQPLTVDSCNSVIYPALWTGSCLHLVSRETASDVNALSQYFQQHPIHCLKIAPSHLNALADFTQLQEVLPLDRMILGGEVSHWPLVEKIQSLAPDCKVFNHYGPTETTVGVLTYPIELGRIWDPTPTVPLGAPLANTQAYVLDTQLQPVPTGIPGELYIGGDSLARGYLHRPELTGESFIPNPFSQKRGTHLYKTGDLVRYLPSGNIEFLGRTDHQVKIHGFRIELGEIETVLRQIPAIRQTVVLAREEESGQGKRLVAYLVSPRQEEISAPELRNFLKEKLPHYMIPSAFVFLKELPLTPHGKIDLKALPPPGRTTSEFEHAYAAPRNLTEEILAGIFSQVLGVERIGINDNFFEVGGDSILSIQIVSRANRAGLHLTPRDIFQHQSIAQLASIAGSVGSTEADQGLVAGPVALTPIQRRFFEQDLPEPHHYNQAVLLVVQRAIDLSLLKEAIGHLISHHDALRLRFMKETTGWRQMNNGPEQPAPFSQFDLSSLSKLEQIKAIEKTTSELQASLNLLDGPIYRVAYFDLGSNKPGRLFIVIHHLAIDGVSWRILLEDLQTAYEQLCRREQIKLAPKTTSFKQWAESLGKYANSKEAMKDAAYWISENDNCFPPLPVDFPEGVNCEASVQAVSVSLSADETKILLQEVPEIYHTQINDVLLTALLETYFRWTGHCSLLIDLEGHGREEIVEGIDLSRTVGWFTTIFPIVLNTRKGAFPGGVLKSVKDQLRRIPKRGFSYSLLRYLCDDKEVVARLKSLPQAEIAFNYLGQFDQNFTQPAIFKLAGESVGPDRGSKGLRIHPLDIVGSIVEERLRFSWTFSKNLYRRSTIERQAHIFIEILRSLILHCQSPEAGGYTPSDFPLTQVNQDELDRALGEVRFR